MKPDLRTGDVFFTFNKRNIISRLMRWFMGSEWSHSGIVYAQTYSRNIVCETSDFHVKLDTFERYIADPNVSAIVYRHPEWFQVIHGNEEFIREECDKLNGKIYGYLQLISFAVRLLLRRIGIKIPHFIRLGTVCNQVCAIPLNKLRDSWLDKVNPKSFDTEEMETILQKSRWVVVYSKS